MSDYTDQTSHLDKPDAIRGDMSMTWPTIPAPSAIYSFVGLRREEVTAHNHGLHKYPAKFIPQIAQWALKYDRTQAKERVLDPFSGSGTAVLEAALNGDIAIGFDISPLATLVTAAKVCKIDLSPTSSRQLVNQIIETGQQHQTAEETQLLKKAHSLHHTWWNWFRPQETVSLLALVDAVNVVCGQRPQERSFLLACVSSIMKRSSYLSEDQIKVRYDKDKLLANPYESFADRAETALERQISAATEITSQGGQAFAACADAAQLPVPDSSIDRIVTSPPYINAVDYTMAHKYNMFLLGLVPAERFGRHRRQYIGVTERAVTAGDLAGTLSALHPAIDPYVTKLLDQDSPVSRNRAFVVWQYFNGMFRSFREMARVMRTDAVAIILVGSTNRICGLDIPTAALLQDLAIAAGLAPETSFFHELANRSSMRLNRSSTGGTVKTETVLVLRARA